MSDFLEIEKMKVFAFWLSIPHIKSFSLSRSVRLYFYYD